MFLIVKKFKQIQPIDIFDLLNEFPTKQKQWRNLAFYLLLTNPAVTKQMDRIIRLHLQTLGRNRG